MANILIVVGSVRKVRVADKVLLEVQKQFESHDITTTVADLKELKLPFLDSEILPMMPEFSPSDERVKKWTQLVGDADSILLIMPEYNHSLTAVLKNALDWLFKEWNDKPVAIVSYGWSGGSLAQEAAKPVLENLKAKQLATTSKLRFMKEVALDGSIIDRAAVDSQIKATVDELVDATKATVIA
ncbi:MAG: NADPH-dependent FMN reductase [Candidatus Saccharimonadales bacterium]